MFCKDMSERPDGSRIVLAHRRADVRELNGAIRAARQEGGELLGERSYATNDGARHFAPGDRVLFLENNRDLGVKNGMLGTVQEAEEGRLVARLDTAQGPGLGREVSVSTADYAAIDHGYATTIHKSQGATVDRAYVLSSGSMDRHLTYVAMTRHREAATLYAGRDEFEDLQGLSERLGRAGLKETTLDYARDFAEQRGMADRLGVSSEIVVPARAESDAQRAKESDREGAARPSELSAEGAARETQPRAAPDREKLRAYGEAAKAAFARSREVAAEGAEERQDERAQTSAPREAQETERQQASPSLDAERMQAIAQGKRSSPSTRNRAPPKPAKLLRKEKRAAPWRPSACGPRRNESGWRKSNCSKSRTASARSCGSVPRATGMNAEFSKMDWRPAWATSRTAARGWKKSAG